MKRIKRLLAFLLCFALILPFLPTDVLGAGEDALTIDNGYIQVSVSTKNGGFLVKTVEGNLLRKSDNNKDLLFHSDAYDTSFVSVRLGSGEDARDYLFGGKYPGASAVSVSKTASGELAAVWTVEKITFTQTISLAGENVSEHGMVSISLSAKNGSGAAVPVQARILLDTCLGDQDWAHYQVNTGNITYTRDNEQYITDEAALRSFYAVDDIVNPSITAYMVSSPTKVAIGHWNNLAATLFDFTPDPAIDCTNYINEYLTADSACAMYYDLGTVVAGGSQSLVCYYGVYSNHNVKRQNSMAVNTVAPLRLMLNDAKTAYVRESEVGVADFAVTVSAENFKSDTSGDLKDVIMAVKSTSGLRSLDDYGEIISTLEFDSVDPLTIPYSKILEGDTVTKTLYFSAKNVSTASYERITVGMYLGDVTTENLLGEKNIYILLPGSDGSIPKVSFNSMTPDTIFNADTRHLYVTVTNPLLLSDSLDAGNCVFKAISDDGKKSWEIPSDNITVNISTGVADIALTDELKLAVGNWQLRLEWTDDAVANEIVRPEFQKQTADKLKFAVSDNPKYRNDTYGVLAVVKYGKGTPQFPYYYRLLNFADEARFKEFSGDKNHEWVEIPLVFRGAFTMDRRYVSRSDGKVTGGYYFSAVSKKTIDPKTREEKVDNPITINNCLDFEGGTISIYYEDYADPGKATSSAILCEFDGQLYTSVERTSVWTGKAAFTKLEQGKDFSLIHYDTDGKRKSFQSNPILLIWPNVFSAAQTLAGMVFKLAYGQLGVMENSKGEVQRVISFSASLSLGFLTSPAGDKTDYGTASYFGRMQELWKDWRGASIYQYAYHGNRYEKLVDIGMNDKDKSKDTQKGVETSVMIQDILFGSEGLVGVNFTVDVTVRNMVESLAKIEAALSVNTIGNWSFGMEGNCEMTDKIKMEAKLKFKSYQNIPIPDELYFYIGGFDPGLNVDGCGVIWITGGGGGFSGLYDTIFYTGGIPPLKLIMTVSFNIVQVLTGTAKLEVSGSGLQWTASGLKIRDAIEVVKKVSVGFYWYPDLKLTGSIYISMFEKCIEGQGYLILLGKDYTDWFFEMYARAAIQVPSSVPAIGGMVIAGVDLGISTEKIWGAIEACKVTVGVTYYWGEDSVEFGSGTKAHPTYPNLLLSGYDGECTDFPVGYDEETGRTLYAHIGTNFEAPTAAQIITDGDLILMDSFVVQSNGTRTSHRFNLREYNAGNNAATLVQLSYEANVDPQGADEADEDYQARGLAKARELAQQFTVQDAKNNPFELIVYNGSNVESANANVTWDKNTQIATFAFSATNPDEFDKDWYISTGSTAADLVLYNVLPLPEVTGVSAGTLAAGGAGQISWTGANLDDLDSISFFLTSSDSPAEDAGYPLGSVTENIGKGSASLTVPGSIPAGEYYLRAIYSKEDQLNGIMHSAAKITVENPSTPAAVGTPAVVPAGDLKLGVTVPATEDPNTTGYLVTVYNADGSVTDITNMSFDKAESGDTVFLIGGSYTAPVREDADDPNSAVSGTQTVGLEGGRSYKVGITPYCILEGKTIVYGAEVVTSAVELPLAVTPAAVLTAEGQTLEPISAQGIQDMGSGQNVQVGPVFTVNGLEIAASFSEAVTGTWALDNSDIWAMEEGSADNSFTGSFSNTTEAAISLPELAEGSHILVVSGQAADGDRFSYSYPFNVDTLAPRLILGSPLNGSPFNADGTVTVSGVSDKNAVIYISIDGGSAITFTPDTDLDGLFTYEAAIPDYSAAATHTLLIWAEDDNGNATAPAEISVIHPGLGDLAGLVIMVNDAAPADGSISTVGGAKDMQLNVLGVTSTGKTFALDRDQVVWSSFAAEGSASVDGDGVLNCLPYTYGFVEARVEVSNGACRTASLVLAGEAKAGRVSVSSTMGGTADGGGDYVPGDIVTLNAYPDEGYLFDGWELSGITVDDLTAETITFTMPEGGVEAKASFRSEAAETFTVSFDPDGGSEVAPQTVESGKTASRPADPTRTGYTFGGWTLDGNDFDFSTPITADVTLKAKWTKNDEPLPEKFTVTFDSDGGSAVASQSVESGKTASRPADPTRTGYTFGGWTLDGNDFDFSAPIAENITLKAKWNKNDEPQPLSFTVTFDPDGGSSVASQTVESGKTASRPADPTRSGYTFGGWTLDGTAFDFSAPITADITLKAKWSKNASGGGTWTEPEPTPAPTEPPEETGPITWVELPEGVDPNRYVPYTLDEDGNKAVIPISAVMDGKLAYLTPEGDREVFFQEAEVSFNDTDGGWAEEYILWTAAHSLFNGVGDGVFAPNGTMTRAMFVTVLYRMAGSPEVTGHSSFTDVPQGIWYEKSVTWAAELGIVLGKGDGKFDPNADVTREQMCVFAARFLRAHGYALDLGEKTEFADADTISDWAVEDVEFCQRAGIINGRPGGIFDPKANATRAENAAVMKRMIEAIIKSLLN